MFKTSLRLFVTGPKQKNPYKDILFFLQMLIMIIFYMKLSVEPKLIFKGMQVVILTRNSTDVNINSKILYLGVIDIIIKYLYVNVICYFIIVSCYFCVYSCYQCIHVYKILILPGAHMYLTAKNTVSIFTTCSSPTEGEHIISNDFFSRKNDFS